MEKAEGRAPQTRVGDVDRQPASPSGEAPSAHALLRLQTMAGNRAVAQLLRSPDRARNTRVQRDPTDVVDGVGAGVSTVHELAADEVVLTTDPSQATAKRVNSFKRKVKGAVEGFGLTFNGLVALRRMKLAKGEGDALVLTWDPSWGGQPVLTAWSRSAGVLDESHLSAQPIRARAALAAATALPGWAKLASATKRLLENLLGGERNELSAAAQQAFKAALPDLKGRTAKEQKTGLEGLTAARPGVVAEPVKSAKVAYTIEGPTDQAAYPFRGATADAEIRTIKFADGIDIKLVAPKAPTPGFHNHTVATTAESASYVPKSARAVVNTILLNSNTNPDDAEWAVTYNTPDFHSYMTAGVAGVVTIYPNAVAKKMPSEDYMRGTLVHETGHTWSYKTWGTDKAAGKWIEWKKAMDKDKLAVSDYATNSIAEDVAETIQVFVTTKGSRRFEEYSSMVPNRFAILKAQYK